MKKHIMGTTPYQELIAIAGKRCGVCGKDTSRNEKRHFERHH